MGKVCSPSFSCDDTVSHCLVCTVRKSGYVCHLQENLDALQRELQKLIQVRNDVQIRLMAAEQQQQMKRLEQVQGWLSRVQDVQTEVRELARERRGRELARERRGGFCSMNCMSSYKFGEKVVETLQDVQSLRNEGNFKEVAQARPLTENLVDEKALPPIVVGLQDSTNQVWRCLMEEEVGILGLYGMGGVGKTTLLTLINNKISDTPNDFDLVIWVVVSKDLQLKRIQDCIARKIDLFNRSWNSKSLLEKAEDIFKVMKKKNATRASNKVVFTTREFEIGGQMEAHKSFEVECLGYDDSWKLFEVKVGRDTLDSHPDIPELAKTVVKECGGLPLALITVGRAMASKKTPREWEHAIEVLSSSAFKFSSLAKKLYSSLKLSYDFLPDDASRFCLLYCSLFPEDYRISIEDLIDCWICEGLLDEYDGIRARNQGYSLICTLLHACLLEKEEENCVKMHDVIRDMALWIASTIDEKEKFLVLAGVGLQNAPGIGLWKEVTRMSLMQIRIRRLLESSSSPHLQTLFLGSNDLNEVNRDFFQFMASLRVLTLSDGSLPGHLLTGISNLVSLQHLDPARSKIRRLPMELKYLVHLKRLNLEFTRLTRIPQEVISNLKMLRVLRMYECGSDKQEGDSILIGGREVLVVEILSLQHLNVLTVTLESFCALRMLLDSPRLQSLSTPSLCLKHCCQSELLVFNQRRSLFIL
ncbi:putative disease resistance protein [Citrus sinensis]|uniref:Disease resistance protein n=1 Tax=Citrus sinensis TaxID=2711 RepID=A0ACB8JD78_CITSI|nr:putative disease resistance protein [Citrus sinensis]